MKTMGVIGLGQIGGSIARGLTGRGVRVVGYDASPDVRALARRASLDVKESFEEVIGLSTIVFVCVTLASNGAVVRRALELADEAPHKPTITDVSSYKHGNVPVDRPQMLIPGHPMAGTHGKGFASSSPDLFGNAQWALIWSPSIDLERLAGLMNAVHSLGAQVQLCDATWHDETVSLVSALPHALALTLGRLACTFPEASARLRLAAGSYKSATRVLLSDETFFRDLVWCNRRTLQPLLKDFMGQLAELDAALGASDSRELGSLVSRALPGVELIERDNATISTVEQIDEAAVFGYLSKLVNSGIAISSLSRMGESWSIGMERMVGPEPHW